MRLASKLAVAGHKSGTVGIEVYLPFEQVFWYSKLLGDYFNNRQCAATGSPIYWRTKSSSTYRQSAQTKAFLKSKLVRYACCKFGHLTKGHRSVYKLTERLFQSLRLFRSFRISGHNTVFRSFQLSGRSGFPVVPAFR
jgi:hypothetical protein